MQVFTLFYLASKFELGKNYTEKEVNQILNNWHTFEDWAMLRRDLYEKRFLWRETKGKEYRLKECQPTLSSFGLTIPTIPSYRDARRKIILLFFEKTIDNYNC